MLGHLNAALKPHGLFFPVDPSTHARCTIGGMAANNSCGSKSIRYGLMADNVAAIDAILADGARFRFGPDWPGQGATKPQVIGELMARLQTLGPRLGAGDRRQVSESAAPSRRVQHRCADAGGGR